MIVIGAGPGGYVAAIRGAQLGLKVAIVEREHMGGICLNWGCIPTKAMLRSAEVFHLMHRAKEFGLCADRHRLRPRRGGQALARGGEAAEVRRRPPDEEEQGHGGDGRRPRCPRKGKVSASRPTRATEELTAKSIVLATGARARELPGLEADGELVWTYKHALQPPRMPKELLVIGSGAIGIEFASFYNTLGAETTVVEVMDRILPVEDAEISPSPRSSS